MSDERPAAQDGEHRSENTAPQNTPPATGANVEVERLRQALERAEQERDSCREALRVAQAERDEYRSTLYAWVINHFAREGPELSEEELIRLMSEEDGLPLEEFLSEVEQAARGG